MPNVKIKALSLYVKGKKAGEFEGVDYDVNSGDEPQFGDPGFLGYSDGAITVSLTATGIHPVGGMSIPDLHQSMLDKEDLDCALSFVNGKIHQVTLRVLTAKTSSHHKNGTQQGTYTLGGGVPTLT